MPPHSLNCSSLWALLPFHQLIIPIKCCHFGRELLLLLSWTTSIPSLASFSLFSSSLTLPFPYFHGLVQSAGQVESSTIFPALDELSLISTIKFLQPHFGEVTFSFYSSGSNTKEGHIWGPFQGAQPFLTKSTADVTLLRYVWIICFCWILPPTKCESKF